MTERPEHTSSTLADSQPATSTRVSFLAFLGFLTSCYLLYHHVAVNHGYQTEPSLCNFGGKFDCEEVARSGYSAVFGIPLASYGLLFYCGLLGICLLLRPSAAASKKERGTFANVLLVVVALSVPPTIALFCISMFLIGKICLFCTAQYVINLLMTLVAVLNRERTDSLGTSLLNGFASLPGLLLGSAAVHGRPRRAAAVFFWILLALVGTGAIAAPTLLLTHIFMPRDSAAVIDKLYEEWESAPVVEIPVNTSDVLLERDFAIGSAGAPILVVVFSDFQCPYCKRAAKHLEGLVARFRGKVRLVFKNYPLDSSCNDAVQHSPHTMACQAALIARCAGLQGEEFFWRTHNALFDLESVEWDLETLLALPEQLNLNGAEMDRCLGEDAVVTRIKKDIALGTELKIDGTPAIFVDGRLIHVARFEHLDKLLERLLKHRSGE